MSRSILITGASRGIGRAVALHLAASEQANLHLLGRDESALAAVAEEVAALGAKAHLHGVSVTDRVALKAAAVGILHLDAVVAAAGISGITPVDDASGEADEAFDTILQTDLTGCWNTVRAFVPKLERGGRIVLVSSVLGRFGVPGYGAYCAAKHGLLGLTNALALELIPKGIFVNAVAPGWVDTNMAQVGIRAMAKSLNLSETEARSKAEQVVPVQRFFRPDEIAHGIAWLLNPANTTQVGQCLNLDGGVVQV